jgi:hypothetical protein
MQNNKKGMPTGRQSGFIELIIIIIVALLIMKYYGITISGAIDWFKLFFSNVLK